MAKRKTPSSAPQEPETPVVPAESPADQQQAAQQPTPPVDPAIEAQQQQIVNFFSPIAEAAAKAYDDSEYSWIAVAQAVLDRWQQQIGQQILIPFGVREESSIITVASPQLLALSEIIPANALFPDLPAREGVAVFATLGSLQDKNIEVVFHDLDTQRELHYMVPLIALVQAIAYERLVLLQAQRSAAQEAPPGGGNVIIH